MYSVLQQNISTCFRKEKWKHGQSVAPRSKEVLIKTLNTASDTCLEYKKEELFKSLWNILVNVFHLRHFVITNETFSLRRNLISRYIHFNINLFVCRFIPEICFIEFYIPKQCLIVNIFTDICEATAHYAVEHNFFG